MITLINPKSGVETSKDLEFLTPPLSLAYLAGSLRENGYKVQIIDTAVENMSYKDVVKKAKESEIVGITSTTPTFRSALELMNLIKSELENVFVVMGGVHVSFMPEEALKYGADVVCIGEGENTIVEIAERVEKGKDLSEVRGICYSEGNRIKYTGARKFEDPNNLPFPAYDLLPLKKYRIVGKRLDYFPIISSRGCPFGCIYCVTSQFMGRKFRAKKPEKVMDELELLYDKFKAKQFAFSDDTFTLNRKRVIEICREIKERGLDIKWSCSSRVDTIDKEMAIEMKRAGCTLIYFGVESASEEILKFYKKTIDLSKTKKALETVKKSGMYSACSFILGAPMETEEDMLKTIETAISLNPDYAQFSILTPYPGTELYDVAKKNGWLLTENFDEYTAGKPVLKNFHLPPERIHDMLRYAYKKFYLRPRYVLKRIVSRDLFFISGLLRTFVTGKLLKAFGLEE